VSSECTRPETQHTTIKQLLAGIFLTVDKNFELEEEGMPALLLHLLKLFTETTIFDSTAGLGCRLVVAFLQATQ
jgi:hypothetical protein